MSINRTTVIGHIGKDAEIIEHEKGAFISFTVAWNDTYTDKSGVKHEKTEWFSCGYQNTNLNPYLRKGTRVEVEGRIGKRAYLTKEGAAAAELTLWVTRLELLSDRKAVETDTAETEHASAVPN